ncbi:hypothetical protein [Lactococcus formosensis]|jgi:hypothetical protein|uniref:Lipoprotein n=1 Tax=Lactococcus formosensis TaxID=1281486 RepID=A0A9Q8Y014_9LACT|nr:hypothetical protein [Lactococcus formosensis]MDG6110951.1 hypothetical protein [Lactococcus formosensis]MDG6117441.1 hypothetical protein [Lactococcus formosensis]MDG6126005.1 hypothetical protein [Lactococcus formosensis]MDG6130860.1 hypothetical protein [Lactococcus formosensis]MDG6132897.1 hypothetical protein [Lactococcus formosensis]
MKKIFLLGATTLVLFSLAACSSNSESKDSESNPKTEQSKVDNSKFDKATENLQSQLENEGSKEWEYKTINNVTNENITNGTLIEIRPKTDEGKNSLKKIYEDSQTGKIDNQIAILAIQQIVSEAAKDLPDDNSEITLGYDEDNDNSVLLAASTRTKDIIKADK